MEQPHHDSPPPAAAAMPVSENDAVAVAVADDADADASNHKDVEQKFDVPREQVTQILQAIASTGKFWHEWDNLKSMLSFQLKQVLSEYPEAKVTTEEQYASLGESYFELVHKLDEELTCFIDGPPFTLQRLCEILLDAKSIYPNLSKLALALEKNLLVTSTLAISTDPCPQVTVQETNEQENASEKQEHQCEKQEHQCEKQEHQSDSAQNGIEPSVATDKDEVMAADKDEVMAEAEADARDDMTVDTEAFEDAKPPETISEPNSETNSNSA
uniref:Serine/threonine-protein phosphatase 4 regulatory subunit 2 n=1 Tax=Lotus japonicus TaxID=34305 RepID=I3SUI6_LOTJA|nr:unknown [Lotus japonicus]